VNDNLINRRKFLQLLGIVAFGMMTPFGCAGGNRYNTQDILRLSKQRQREREESGQGPFGTHRYRGYKGLSELPYFELNQKGRLICVVDDLPPIIDFHVHLGTSVLFAPKIDLHVRTNKVSHLLDCDMETPGCELDLDVYANANFTDKDLKGLRRDVLGQMFWGSARAETHTIPNLIDEMTDMGVKRALLLPIIFGLPYRDDSSELWYSAVRKAGETNRLLLGASVHPRDANAIEKLRTQAARGARVIKLHPAAQRFYPDSPKLHAIYEECRRLGIVVFFHGGRAGIEPKSTHRFTLIRHYEDAVGQHPNVRFILGHAGARDVADAIPFTNRHKNVWLDIHGQGITVLRELIDRVGFNRLIFGSDWPFYHIGVSLAKVLIVTEGRPEERLAIFNQNARMMLGES